jgi:hypothetical protein
VDLPNWSIAMCKRMTCCSYREIFETSVSLHPILQFGYNLEYSLKTKQAKSRMRTWKVLYLTCVNCSTTQVFQQRTNTFSNHSHNQIKDQHTDVFTW